MAYRVFVSHAWSDLWVAQQIERRIRQDAQVETFIDAFDIAKGDDFEERIFGEMRRVDELAVLLTPWSVDRHWLWVEIGAARAHGCRIVPILYHLSLDDLDKGGGATFLKAKNVVAMNEMETYLTPRSGAKGSNEMSRVFLSYALDDRPFAERLARVLSARGAETFDPVKDFEPGENWSDAILKSLRRADLLVFVVPRFEGQGKSALVEVGAAKAMGKRIVSVLPDRARAANTEVATALGETHYLGNDRDLNKWADRVLSELKAA
jgi:hypothetical protein